ncbi:unnamed protein product [Caenorhabditis auriculariae]|uniref:Uncharacterized protein n=1 Tax=Caenorhabditis auriculariae TaxID=2777116 RepID=A0A8S1H3W2_9PELO|nr:unnamed protein product [Caenorhabditis auriculariae]
MDIPAIVVPDRLEDDKLYMDAPGNDSTTFRNVYFSTGNDYHDDTCSSDSDQNQLKASPSKSSFLSDLKLKRASQLIVDLPVYHLNKIKNTEGVGSIDRETMHFSNTTTMHGPKRIYNGKRLATIFWAIIVTASFSMLIWQIVNLILIFFSRPTVSEVSFVMSDNGMPFPRVTVCSFNPIAKTYVERLNTSGGGDFSDDLLNYLMLYNVDAQTLYGRADAPALHYGDGLYQAYSQKHSDFSADEFFMDAGFNCSQMFKLCSFAGRRFDCCRYTRPVFSDLGKCYTLDVQGSDKEWMHKQVEPGIAAGLQIILDSHLEEVFNLADDGVPPVFSNTYENGFRYYVHDSQSVPFLSTEGISVSPNSVVYSALSSSRYVLLSSRYWGNCTEEWPPEYSHLTSTVSLQYSADMCSSLCKARYFYENCGCSPTIYNYKNVYPDCTPYQTLTCMDNKMRVFVDGSTSILMPKCAECRLECNSLVYQAYNSYGQGLSRGGLAYLSKQGNWTIEHMQTNFQIINVFFRDMSYTEYTQVQGSSITETLSDIGGNMGMFLGMSVITITEISMYLSKIGWIAVSRRRRDYLFSKKQHEKEHEKELEEVVSGFKLFRKRKSGAESMSNLRDKIRGVSLHRVTTTELDASRLAWQEEEDEEKRIRSVTQQSEALRSTAK